MKNKNVIKQYITLILITAVAVAVYIACYQKPDGQLATIDIYKPIDNMIEILIENNGELNTNVFSACDYNLQNLVIITIGSICSKMWTGLKIYYILSFFMISVSVYWCLTKMKISSPIAIGMSVLAAFLPFHVDRGGGQIITSNFFLVPLFLGIWYDLLYEKNYSENKKINIFYMTIMCLAPFIDIRVSWMMIILTIILLINRSDMEVTKKVAVYLLPSIMLSVFAGVLTGIIGSGDLTEKIELAKTEGLRLLDMLMPVRYHIVGKLNDMRLNYDIGFSASGESGLNTMGLLISAGFVCGMLALFFGSKCDKKIKWLSWINIIVIFISNIHGLNLFFEYIGLNLAYWNRMGIFILINSILITGMFADYVKEIAYKKFPHKICKAVVYILFTVIWFGAYMELLLRSYLLS